MKYLALIVVFFLISFSTQAEIPDEKELLKEALGDYGLVAAGWYVNEHCQIIKGEDRKAFESNVATITTALRIELTNPDVLLTIQKGAKISTNKEPYLSCGKEAKKLFMYAFNHSSNWSKQITKLTKAK
jgi:hypothetical protein